MKLIITGATGFVGTEVLRQSLQKPEITSVVAVARKPVTAPEGTDATKLKSVVVKDYGEYSEEVKGVFSGADACIWTVAITPYKARPYAFDEVRRVCQTWTLAGLRALREAQPAKPFRFLYMSGLVAERDPKKKPLLYGDYSLMRGETEKEVIAYAAETKGEIEACCAKPGEIMPSSGFLASIVRLLPVLPTIGVHEVAAAMLDQVVGGFAKETLDNLELRRLGQKSLGTEPKA